MTTRVGLGGRRRTLAGFVTAGVRSGTGFGAGLSRVYGLALMLLALTAFLLMFRGETPRTLERVFVGAQGQGTPSSSERRDKLKALLGGAFLDPADGTDFAETPGYAKLIGMMLEHSPAIGPNTDLPVFNRELALREPDVQRSEPVSFHGVVADFWAEKLDQPVYQITDVWRTVLTDGDGNNGVVVDFLERPPAFEIQRDQVEGRGVFYRLVSYQTRKGDSVVVPYLLARSLTIVPKEERSPLSHPAAKVILFAILAMAAYGIGRIIVVNRRRPTVRWRAPTLSHSKPPEGGNTNND